MKKILLAPSLMVALGVSGYLLAQGNADFSSKVNKETPPAGAADASTAASPSSLSRQSSSSLSFSTTADRASVSLGDRVVVTYTAKLPEGATLSLDSLVTPAPGDGAQPPGGAVLEFESPTAPTLTRSKTGDFFEWSQSVALFPFAAGTVRVPGPHYTFRESSSGRTLDVRPPDLELEVVSRLPKDQKPDEIAPKVDKPVRIPAWPAKYWGALAAGVAVVAALLTWLVTRRRRGTAGVEAGARSLEPGEELRLALARLAAAAESLGDDARGFYSELTHAVKHFLERATGEPVLEWTTFETVRRLREKGFEFPRDAAFPDLLASADRVKFAKGPATREDARQALMRARFVLDDVETRQKAQEAARAAAAAAPKERAS